MIAAHEETVTEAHPLLGREPRTLTGLPVGDDVRAQVPPAVDCAPQHAAGPHADRRLDTGVVDPGQAATTSTEPAGA